MPADDPTVYVNITSKDIPLDAPKGCENWFVMVNVPTHKNQDWEQLIPKYKENIISKLNSILKTDIRTLIETENTLTPLDIELKTSSQGGSLYGTSSNSRYAAFLRHTNDHKDIEGLFFCRWQCASRWRHSTLFAFGKNCFRNNSQPMISFLKNRFQLSLVLLIIVYMVGIVSVLLGHAEALMLLTPYNLLFATGLLLYNAEGFDKKIWALAFGGDAGRFFSWKCWA